MIIICTQLFKNTKIVGMSLYPFILLKNREDKNNLKLINHEKIHLRQQLELLIIFFYIWYLLEYFYWRLLSRDKNHAYLNICFEKEAYQNENDLYYLKTRKLFNFVKYIKR